MKVYVLMQNDFPIAVLSDEDTAKTAKEDKTRQSKGVRPRLFFHLHEFDLDGRV